MKIHFQGQTYNLSGPLYATTGSATNGAMTQKATTEALQNLTNTLTERTSVTRRSYNSTAVAALDTYWYIHVANNKWQRTTANYNACLIPVDDSRGMTVTVRPAQGTTAHLAFIPAKPTAVSTVPVLCEGCSLVRTADTFVATVPPDAAFLYVARRYNQANLIPESIDITCEVTDIASATEDTVIRLMNHTYHVDAENGSDDNDGLAASRPLATMAKAAELAGPDLSIILHGDTTEAFSPTGKRSVSIAAPGGEMARIIRGNRLTQATLDAQTGIYSADVSQCWTSRATIGTYWLYQHDVPDEGTRVDFGERHPLQRGRECRCGSLRIPPVASLDELIASSTPAYWYDGSSAMLHFRIAEGTALDEHPLILPQYSDYGIRYSGENFRATGIEVLYATFNLKKSTAAVVTDCAARYAFADGCWMWNGARALQLTRCEAARATAGNAGGDGFNAHSTATEDTEAKLTTHTLTDCWAHDNNDDGYSDHERCEGTVVGGLFEYNGKGGITPAVGAHDTIYHACCRRQTGAGILYTGVSSVAEGGVGGQLYAEGCLCADNGGNNYYVRGGMSQSGYPDRVTLVGCISLRAGGYAFFADTNCNIILHNCSDQGSAHTTGTEGSSASITIDNAALVQ